MKNDDKSETQDRDQHILRRLVNIEHKIDSIEQTTAFVARANYERHSESVRQIFHGSTRRAQVYLAANGQRSVQDIAALLGMKQPNVSRELEKLGSEGLLEIIEKDAGKAYWGKKPIDKTIRISKLVMEEYALDKNGLPVK